jgi:DNA mismatch endonuclease, patch repair protein
MVDVLTQEQRRLNMSRIRARNTKPELLLRSGLHGRGLRFRLHRRDLPGCPDLVFPRFRTVIFVHGCFWHRHQCHLFKMPQTRPDFWRKKIEANVARDKLVIARLHHQKWRVLVIWECAIRGKRRLEIERVLDVTEAFLLGAKGLASVTGRR